MTNNLQRLGFLSIFLLAALYLIKSCASSPVVGFEEAHAQEASPPPENFSEHCKATPPKEFDRLVRKAARKHKINPRVLALTVYRESACREKAVGAAGEIGLGQVNPRVWKKTLIEKGYIKSPRDLHDAQTNLMASAFILSEMNRRAKGDPVEALRRYNGSGKAARKYAKAQKEAYKKLWGETVWVAGI